MIPLTNQNKKKKNKQKQKQTNKQVVCVPTFLISKKKKTKQTNKKTNKHKKNILKKIKKKKKTEKAYLIKCVPYNSFLQSYQHFDKIRLKNDQRVPLKELSQ